jgi:hypothetical protein
MIDHMVTEGFVRNSVSMNWDKLTSVEDEDVQDEYVDMLERSWEPKGLLVQG